MPPAPHAEPDLAALRPRTARTGPSRTAARPVRNATLTGNANNAMLRIDAVARGLAMDGATGSCGKDGQRKPAGVGQPTVRFTEFTVGGTIG